MEKCINVDGSYSYGRKCGNDAVYKITITNPSKTYSVVKCVKCAKKYRHKLNYEINNLGKNKSYIQTEIK